MQVHPGEVLPERGGGGGGGRGERGGGLGVSLESFLGSLSTNQSALGLLGTSESCQAQADDI